MTTPTPREAWHRNDGIGMVVSLIGFSLLLALSGFFLRGGELPFQTLIVGWTLVYLAIFGSAFALMFIAPRVSGHVVLASLIYFLALLVEPLVTAGWSTPGRFTPLFVGVLIAAGTVRQKAYGPISIFIAIGLGLAAILVEFI